jgi:hypothetical protein
MRPTMYLMMRITQETVPTAIQAFTDGGLVELKDRHGIVHKGWVRSHPEYQFGRDAGHYIAFEMVEDESTVAVLQRVLTQPRPHR